jgi:hypothetical protein
MFLLDNLLLGPGKAAMFVFNELARKAQADWLDDDSVKQELMELYALVEAGKISSQEFESRECRLLARLEQIAKAKFNDKWGGAEAEQPPLLEGTVVDVASPALELEPEPIPEPVPAPAFVAAPIAPPVYNAPPTVSRAAPPVDISPPAVYNGPPPVSNAPPPVYNAPPPAYSAPLPVYLPPAPAPAPPPPTVPPAPGAPLSVTQVLESATRALAMLHLKLSAITSVSPGEDGWRVTAELVERRGVPDTSDLLGVYELRLDAAGNVLRYERTHIRRRCDLGRT